MAHFLKKVLWLAAASQVISFNQLGKAGYFTVAKLL